MSEWGVDNLNQKPEGFMLKWFQRSVSADLSQAVSEMLLSPICLQTD